MTELVRSSKQIALSEPGQRLLLATSSAGAFGWLLAQDQVHPLVVYFLQLYLAF